MSTLSIELTEDQAQQLRDMAVLEGTTPEAVAQQWVRQRMVHERERATGTARPMSPRSWRPARQQRQDRMDLLQAIFTYPTDQFLKYTVAATQRWPASHSQA